MLLLPEAVLFAEDVDAVLVDKNTYYYYCYYCAVDSGEKAVATSAEDDFTADYCCYYCSITG